MKVFTALAITIILSQCGWHQENQAPKAQIVETKKEITSTDEIRLIVDLKVDSVRSWIMDSISFNDYLFSPIDSSKVWLFSAQSTPYELDLTNSSWTPLNSKFGDFAYKLTKKNVFNDKFDKQVIWIGNYFNGLLRYNKSTQATKEYRHIKHVSSMQFTADEILIGSQKGFHILIRSSDSITTISELEGNRINSMEVANRKVKLENACYKFHYDLELMSLTSIDTFNCQTYRHRNVKQPDHGYKLAYAPAKTNIWSEWLSIQKGEFKFETRYTLSQIGNILFDSSVVWVPRSNRNLEVFAYYLDNSKKAYNSEYPFRFNTALNNENLIWFQNNFSIIYFDKNAEQFYQTEVRSSPRNLATDSDYLYFISSDGFHAYSKKYLFNHSVNVKELNKQKAEFDKHDKNFARFEDFKMAYEYYDSVYTRFSSFNHQEMIKKLHQLRFGLVYTIPDNLTEAIDLEKKYFDSISQDNVKAACFLQIIKMANHQGELGVALKYDSVLTAELPKYRSKYHKTSMSKVREGEMKLREIQRSELYEDERLWLKGKLYLDLLPFVGPTNESQYDMTFPFEFFRKLLEKYPESQFAGNAEITMQRYNSDLSYEGGGSSYITDAIDKLEILLKKYPQTDLRAQMYDDISILYYDVVELDSARKYSMKVISEFPHFVNIEQTKKRLKNIKNSMQID